MVDLKDRLLLCGSLKTVPNTRHQGSGDCLEKRHLSRRIGFGEEDQVAGRFEEVQLVLEVGRSCGGFCEDVLFIPRLGGGQRSLDREGVLNGQRGHFEATYPHRFQNRRRHCRVHFCSALFHEFGKKVEAPSANSFIWVVNPPRQYQLYSTIATYL